MINFLKNLYFKYKCTKQKDYEIYYNHVLKRQMFVKLCPICNNNIYVFELSQLKQHQIECSQFFLLMQRRNYFI